jgi:hypothetical protein
VCANCCGSHRRENSLSKKEKETTPFFKKRLNEAHGVFLSFFYSQKNEMR